MKFTEEDVLLRIFVSESAKSDGKPLYEQIILHAKNEGLAGATAIRGIMGFGADSRMHSLKLLDLSSNLPIVVEIVDREEKINNLLPWLDSHVQDGFMTLEKVSVIRYRK